MAHPPFNTALGGSSASLEWKPPFLFEGVTIRVFPLKASPAKLRAFCDSYLNIMPPEIAHFRPALPWVYLVVLDYGDMASLAGNFGWVSQHEVGFTIALEHCRQEHGRMVFRDWAYVSPFIFVNDQMSLTTGREVYGWPKVLAWLDPEVDRWVNDPDERRRLMTLSTMIFPEVYAGKKQQPRRILEIDGTPPRLTFPPADDSPLNFLLDVPEAILASASLAGDAIGALRDLWIDGVMGDSRALLQKSLRFFRNLSLVSPDLSATIITLKQFRDAQFPDRACYQALISSGMRLEKVKRFGLLGGLDALRLDPSSGVRIKLHRYAAQPIVESLGLEVAAEEKLGGRSAAVLKPVFPYWVDVSLHYGAGVPICWRTRTSSWHLPAESQRPRVDVGPHSAPPRSEETKATGHPFYDTARGGATQQISGPFSFPRVTVRVLPLAADEGRLRQLLEGYPLEQPLDRRGRRTRGAGTVYSFQPLAPLVLLIVTTFDQISSATDNIGGWARREVTFAIPARMTSGAAKKGSPPTPVLIQPFVFVDGNTAAITSQDVYGLPAVQATIGKPGDTWLDQAGPASGKHFLTVKSQVLPELYMAQKAREATVLKIHQPVVSGGEAPGNRQGGPAKLALELFQDGIQRYVTLKQFRDSEEPDLACFQSLLLTRRITTRMLQPPKEIDQPLEVEIFDYQSVPIVQLLGLLPTRGERQGHSLVRKLQAVRPFWLQVAMEAGLGEELLWRSGSTKWHVSPQGPVAALA